MTSTRTGITTDYKKFFPQQENFLQNNHILLYVMRTTTYTGCPRRNVPDFGRVFLKLKYTDIPQNTNVQS
jgi:hypothetical protein